MKGISPLIASVLLIAFTLTVAALLAGWFTSITKSITTTSQSQFETSVNCSSAVFSIDDVICSSASQQLKVAVTNFGSLELYSFSTLANINSTLYVNSTGGPNSTSPLRTGEQHILSYGCSNTTYCVGNATISLVRVSVGSCPIFTEYKKIETCT